MCRLRRSGSTGCRSRPMCRRARHPAGRIRERTGPCRRKAPRPQGRRQPAANRAVRDRTGRRHRVSRCRSAASTVLACTSTCQPGARGRLRLLISLRRKGPLWRHRASSRYRAGHEGWVPLDPASPPASRRHPAWLLMGRLARETLRMRRFRRRRTRRPLCPWRVDDVQTRAGRQLGPGRGGGQLRECPTAACVRRHRRRVRTWAASPRAREQPGRACKAPSPHRGQWTALAQLAPAALGWFCWARRRL